jgi:flagellar hook-length control protein FliK
MSAPAAAAPAGLPQPILVPVAAQVAVTLAQAVQNGTDRIEIQLKPASLGAIDVKLDLAHDGRITAVITADRSDTLNMLRQDSSQLQQALRDAGLQADSGSLSFNLRSDPQAFSQNDAPARSDRSPAAEPVATAATRVAASYHRRHAGALDINV